jgi:hypothetical protein
MKKFFIILVIIIGILLLIPALMPKDFSVERQVVINKPLEMVFPFVTSLKGQDDWSVWGSLDPDMKKEYRGEDGTVGFVSAWEGNEDVGKGEQEITGIEINKRVDFELRFIEPWEATNQAWLTVDPAPEGATNVRWGISGNMPYPMNAMLLFMNLEENIGKDFEQGLLNLKRLVESLPMIPENTGDEGMQEASVEIMVE